MNNDTIKEIKERLSVSEVLGEYINIVQRGSVKKALCPFHNEKTPSFVISDDKKMWHCFGCGKGGDIFTFLEEYEGMEFGEALSVLAQKAGVIVEQNQVENTRRTLLFRALMMAGEYWGAVLKSEHGADARKYCEQRGITKEDIETFNIGYAPDDWSALSLALKKKGFSDDIVFSAGLTVRSEKSSGFYDRFRGRIMFPLCDVHGQILGFSGRIIISNEHEGKYVNTPQTEVYDKSAVLFGINLAKEHIKKIGHVILVEGQMDVIASHRVGVKNVVAVSGTALTQKQLDLLGRYTKKVALCFDSDVAGLKAAIRSLSLLWDNGFDVYAIILPSGKDPDECIRTDASVWNSATTKLVPILDLYLEILKKQFSITSAEGKREIVKEFLSFVIRIQDPVVQSHYIQKLSTLVSVPDDVLRSILQNTKRSQQKDLSVNARGSSQSFSSKTNISDGKKRNFDEYVLRLFVIMSIDEYIRDLVNRYIDLYKLDTFHEYKDLLKEISDITTLNRVLEERKLLTGFVIIEEELKELSQKDLLKEFVVLSNTVFISSDNEYKYELPRIKTDINQEIQKKLKDLDT